MTSTSITAPGLSGVLRMTWVHDDLAHVLEHAERTSPPAPGPAWHVAITNCRSEATSTT